MVIDLSTSEEEKKSYVMNLELSEDCSEYIVTYADGHKANFPFSIHNFNAEIYRMISRFKEKKREYTDVATKMLTGSLIKEVKTTIVSLIGLVLTASIPMPNVMRIIIIALMVLYNLFIIIGHRATVKMIGTTLEMLEAEEYCFDMLDKFKVEVTDPHNGSKEEWFLMNPTNMVPPMLMMLFSKALTPEIRKEEGDKLTEMFKEAYESKLGGEDKMLKR